MRIDLDSDSQTMVRAGHEIDLLLRKTKTNNTPPSGKQKMIDNLKRASKMQVSVGSGEFR